MRPPRSRGVLAREGIPENRLPCRGGSPAAMSVVRSGLYRGDARLTFVRIITRTTDDTGHVRHSLRDREWHCSLEGRGYTTALPFRFTGVSPRSITDPHDCPRVARRWHVPRVAIDEWRDVVTAHREQSPVRRFRVMTWRTNDRGTVSRGLYRPELSSTGGRHARSGSRCPCRDGTGSSPSDSPRRQMVCEQGASGARSLSGGRSSLSPVPSSLPSSSRARSGNHRGRGRVRSALDASRLACCPWVV